LDQPLSLDVHQHSIAIAVADAGRSPAKKFAEVENDWHRLLKQLGSHGSPEQLRLCYEAGPTGYELARSCPRCTRRSRPTEVTVPAAQTEAMRDLERARSDAKEAERIARQQLSSFLLRHNRRWTGASNWTLSNGSNHIRVAPKPGVHPLAPRPASPF